MKTDVICGTLQLFIQQPPAISKMLSFHSIIALPCGMWIELGWVCKERLEDIKTSFCYKAIYPSEKLWGEAGLTFKRNLSWIFFPQPAHSWGPATFPQSSLTAMIMTAVSTLYKMTTLSTFYKMTAAAVYKPSFSTPMIMFNQCQSEPTGQNLHPLLHVPPWCLLCFHFLLLFRINLRPTVFSTQTLCLLLSPKFDDKICFDFPFFLFLPSSQSIQLPNKVVSEPLQEARPKGMQSEQGW